MTDTLLRLGVLALVGLALWLVIWSGRRFVEHRQQMALQAAPAILPNTPDSEMGESSAPVRILNFSSAACHQCFRLQKPALRRLLETRREVVTVVEVDAPSAPELTRRYHVLTLPTTIVLDAAGQAQAVNFGFAPTERLLAQVDAILAKTDPVRQQLLTKPAL